MRPWISFVLFLGLSVGTGLAQELTVPDTLGWHVVSEGETMESITERYLGTSTLWRENWKLNPTVRDPHLIRPGQRLRIILERQVPARQVEIRRVARQVDKNLQQGGWQGATPGDLLKPRDGVRTLRNASTELLFDDGSILTLNENSQVFVKNVRTTLTGVKRGEIEVERGQAELVVTAPRPDLTRFEVVVGNAVTRPQVGIDGRSATRARKRESGGSEVMVYGGKAQVEAGGVAVEVGRGMGTAVPENGPPKAPEKLLPRPTTLSPKRRSEWAFNNPQFQWQTLNGAASYTVEVCHDAGCAELVERATDLTETAWKPSGLPSGDLYWRVTATAASGLDGYPSRAVPFTIAGSAADLEPPVVVAMLDGPGEITPDGTFRLGPGGFVELTAHDDAAGVEEIRFRWNDGAWTRWRTNAKLTPPASPARLEFQASDRLGRESKTWSVNVERDEEAPEEPKVEIAPGDGVGMS